MKKLPILILTFAIFLFTPSPTFGQNESISFYSICRNYSMLRESIKSLSLEKKVNKRKLRTLKNQREKERDLLASRLMRTRFEGLDDRELYSLVLIKTLLEEDLINLRTLEEPSTEEQIWTSHLIQEVVLKEFRERALISIGRERETTLDFSQMTTSQVIVPETKALKQLHGLKTIMFNELRYPLLDKKNKKLLKRSWLVDIQTEKRDLFEKIIEHNLTTHYISKIDDVKANIKKRGPLKSEQNLFKLDSNSHVCRFNQKENKAIYSLEERQLIELAISGEILNSEFIALHNAQYSLDESENDNSCFKLQKDYEEALGKIAELKIENQKLKGSSPSLNRDQSTSIAMDWGGITNKTIDPNKFEKPTCSIRDLELKPNLQIPEINTIILETFKSIGYQAEQLYDRFGDPYILGTKTMGHKTTFKMIAWIERDLQKPLEKVKVFMKFSEYRILDKKTQRIHLDSEKQNERTIPVSSTVIKNATGQ